MINPLLNHHQVSWSLRGWCWQQKNALVSKLSVPDAMQLLNSAGRGKAASITVTMHGGIITNDSWTPDFTTVPLQDRGHVQIEVRVNSLLWKERWSNTL
jgi:hypothetical protein